jgi:hypothetical protein
MVVYDKNPNYSRGRGERILTQGLPRANVRPYQRAESVAEVVNCLQSKCKHPRANPNSKIKINGISFLK